jgi:hypothetical protein
MTASACGGRWRGRLGGIAGAWAARSEARNRRARWMCSIRQWRCHPRLSDATSALFGLPHYGFKELSYRSSLLWRCARSGAGEEPMDAFLLDPTGEMYKPRWQDGRRVGVAWDGSRPLDVEQRMPGDDMLRPRAARSVPPNAKS